VLSACGKSGTKATAGTGPATTGSAPGNADWQRVVDAAKKEGSVTIYSSQPLDALNAFAKKFEAKYGIHVEVYRGLDNDLNAKIGAEKQTGKGIADMVVIASQPLIQAKVTQGGWFLPVSGPDFDAPAYNKAVNYQPGDYFLVGAAILTFGWNTQLYPKGLKDYPDLLDPALGGGKIGVIEPTAPSYVDFYQDYLSKNFGANFVTKLAAQKPRIYQSALPMAQALGSGEIAAALFVQPQGDTKNTGAPVDSGISPSGTWGARYFGAVLATAPHPNAAKLLADFMVAPEGQTLVTHNGASVLPNIQGAVTTTDKVNKQDLSLLTADKVAAYEAKWHAWFK
jgi:iron(III) transport system substrate-binding protein